MIVGLGNDILEIKRIEEAIKKDRFMEKYFTSKERQLFEKRKHNSATIAANFSAKEAVSKALGTGIRGFALKDIEILRNELGQPIIRLYDQALKIADDLSINRWHVTISHNKKYVNVTVIGEKI